MSLTEPPPELDLADPRLARSATGLLREFNLAGVLSAADVNVATRLSALGGEGDEAVRLAVALAVRAPRVGHVYVDLATIRATAAAEGDGLMELPELPWPEAEAWLARVGSSSLVAGGDAPGEPRPLRLLGSWLYLDRYWEEERQVAEALLARAEGDPPPVEEQVLQDGLERLFEGDGRQRAAAAASLTRRLAVIAGGPGTGKTTTVARVAALLCEQAQARGERPPLIALAAPTGKAAARLREAVQEEAARMNVGQDLRRRLLELEAMTLHRLLGRRPGSQSRFRHDRHRRLPHDAVIVDETSMVSLTMMERLLEAVRPQARLVLVGDPDQLASIEAGAVLGDIVGPAREGLGAERSRSGEGDPSRGSPPLTGAIVPLERVHRFGGRIAQVAAAVRLGDVDAVMDVLRGDAEDVIWIAGEGDKQAPAGEAVPAAVRERAVTMGRSLVSAARRGDALAALEALGSFRILCAHRRGPHGVATWSARVEAWLEDQLPGLSAEDPWYPGRPLLVGQNDYELGLHNGDTGVVVRGDDGEVVAAFPQGRGIVRFSPSRLSVVATVYAMTIHKSQGSQFSTAAVLLPDLDSPILTRELLYTAATRAREQLILVGSEERIRAAVTRPVARASGLRRRLWDEPRVAGGPGEPRDG